MFVCACNSDYAIVSLVGKDIKLEEIERAKMNPEFGVFAINSTSGEKQLIAKFEYREYAISHIHSIKKWMQNSCHDPQYSRLLNCNPNSHIWAT